MVNDNKNRYGGYYGGGGGGGDKFSMWGGDVAVVDGEAELVVAAGINGLVVVGKGREEHGEA